MDQATVQTPPAGRRRGFIFWILVIVSVPIVLFVGSAVNAGVMDSNERSDAKEKA